MPENAPLRACCEGRCGRTARDRHSLPKIPRTVQSVQVQDQEIPAEAMQYCFHFLPLKSTGGIQHHPAGFQHFIRLTKQLFSVLGHIRPVHAIPSMQPYAALSETCLPRTRCINQDLIKVLRIKIKQLLWIFTCHTDIRDTEQLQIFEKRLCPGTADVIRKQNPLSFRRAPSFVAFPPGAAHKSRTRSPRFHRQAVSRRHCARLLQIIQPCRVIRIFRWLS